MLTQQTKSRIETAYASMLGNGLNKRPGQARMIEEVARTLALAGNDNATENRVSLVNAPTGTGKTLSYLLPRCCARRGAGNCPLGGCEPTSVALQRQLADKDVPMAAKALGVNPKVAVAVGQGRYACPLKVEEAR